MSDWYLIYTKVKQEAVALMNLEQQGYEAYLPLHRARRLFQRRYKVVTEPLFPRYLFIALNSETDDWGPIRSTRGVAKLVRFGGLPAKVPTELVEFIKAQEAERLQESVPLPQFKQGDRVQIMEGVMAGYEGIFDINTGAKRASILLSIADRYTSVQVDIESLERQ